PACADNAVGWRACGVWPALPAGGRSIPGNKRSLARAPPQTRRGSRLSRPACAAPRPVPLDQLQALGGSGEFQLNFDDVGDFGQGLAVVVGHVIVERDQIARLLQPLTG